MIIIEVFGSQSKKKSIGTTQLTNRNNSKNPKNNFAMSSLTRWQFIWGISSVCQRNGKKQQ